MGETSAQEEQEDTHLSIVDHLKLENENENSHSIKSAVRKAIYLFGGASKSSRKGLDILRYNIEKDKWENLGISYDMIRGRAAVLSNGNISLIGGKDGDGKMLNIHEFDISDCQVNFLTNDGEFLERSGFAGVQSRGTNHQ